MTVRGIKINKGRFRSQIITQGINLKLFKIFTINEGLHLFFFNSDHMWCTIVCLSKHFKLLCTEISLFVTELSRVKPALIVKYEFSQ